MKLYLLLAVIFFISGCSSKESRYIFPSTPNNVVANTKVQIGVKEVVVPSYLNSDKILVKSGAKITQIDAKFADTPSKMLTQKEIEIFKKSLNNPYVFLYPWEVKRKSGYIVEIKLDDIIYEDKEVILAGSYYIKSSNGSIKLAKNFILKEMANKDAKSIVTSISTLFNNLVVEIAKKIAR